MRTVEEQYEADLEYEDLQHLIARQSEAIQAVAESVRNLHRSVIEGTVLELDDRLRALEDRILDGLNRPAEVDYDAEAEHQDDYGSAEPAADDPLAELRRAFFEDEAPAPPAQQSRRADDKVSAPETASAAQSPAYKAETEPEEELLPFEIPEPVDPDQLNEAELRQALLDRETLLRTMVAYARRKTQQPHLMTLDDLRAMADSLPDELAARVEETLARQHQHQRLGELELSLERARVGRQMTQLQATRQQLESNARKLGLTISDEGRIVEEVSPSQQAAAARKTRRWLGALGFGK